MTDARGVPISIAISGANLHDSRALLPVVDHVAMDTPRGCRRPRNICLDKAHNSAAICRALKKRKIIPHIRRRGEALVGTFRGKSRRWVGERCISWHNNFRSIKTRWDRKGKNYLALLHLASAIIAYKQILFSKKMV